MADLGPGYAVARCRECDDDRDGADDSARKVARWAREHSRRTGHHTEVDVTYTRVYGYDEEPDRG